MSLCQELLCIWNSPLWVEPMNLKMNPWLQSYSRYMRLTLNFWRNIEIWHVHMILSKLFRLIRSLSKFSKLLQSESASDDHVILRSNFENAFLNFAFFLCYKSLQCYQPNHPFLGDLPLWKVTNKVSRVSKIYKKSWQNRITELTWNDVQ